MITYEQIQKVNEGMNGIDFKGKNYVMVNSRVTAFRKLFPEGFIHTDLLSLDNGTAVMQSKVGYYDNGKEIVLGTGMAYEKESTSYINKTSFIENCETSAVGRALGFLALGSDDSICSAEELANAIKTQEQIKEREREQAQPDGKVIGGVEMKKGLPTVANLMRNEICDIQEKLNLKTYDEARKQVFAWGDELMRSGAIEKFEWVKITPEQAKGLFEAIRKTYKPGEAA